MPSEYHPLCTVRDGIVTSPEPLNPDEYRMFRQVTEQLVQTRADAMNNKTRAMQALIDLITAFARVRNLPQEGGRYHAIFVDGCYYIQWWSNDYIAYMERYGQLSF